MREHTGRLDSMCILRELIWTPSITTGREEASDLEDAFGIIGIKPFLLEEDNEVLTYLLLTIDNHPNGTWVFMHHVNVDIVAPVLADFLFSTPGQYDEVFPMYQAHTCQVPAKPDEMEPGFMVGVELAEGRMNSRF